MIKKNYKVFLLYFLATIIYQVQIFLVVMINAGTRVNGGSQYVFGVTFPSNLYWFFPLIFLTAIFFYLKTNDLVNAYWAAALVGIVPITFWFLLMGFIRSVHFYGQYF